MSPCIICAVFMTHHLCLQRCQMLIVTYLSACSCLDYYQSLEPSVLQWHLSNLVRYPRRLTQAPWCLAQGSACLLQTGARLVTSHCGRQSYLKAFGV